MKGVGGGAPPQDELTTQKQAVRHLLTSIYKFIHQSEIIQECLIERDPRRRATPA